MTLIPVRKDHSFEIGQQPRLDVDIPAGTVRVQIGAPGMITVSIDTSDPDAVDVTQLGDSVSVRLTGRWIGRGRPVNVAATVPPLSEITVSTASADMRLVGEFGATRLRTASGNIEIERVDRGDLDATSGDVRLGKSTGSLSVSTVSGDVTVGEVGGRLNASLTSGDLRVDIVDGGVDVATTSGDVWVRRCNGDDISLKSVSGDVAIGLPSGIRVDPDISTLSGKTTLPSPVGGTPNEQERRRVRLRVHTISGDIRIERA